ncbi:hypothetical protein PY365_22875 [Roseiarcaceae bacterium H3SJ34-1]|uniref:hypothetical protein n=1 Tax=Terripilifer ovatus TaxID=3032367 RepID=UPI003AB965C1|nr:hypothetical protein [Roseiarcaceae bacterium H3SJ34-1]
MFSSGRQVYAAGLAFVGSSLRSSIFYLTIALLACLALPRSASTADSATKEGHLEQISASSIAVAGMVTRSGVQR